MTDEYRLIVRREADGEYTTELTYNGKIARFKLLGDINQIIMELITTLENSGIPANFRKLNRLEIAVSGEKSSALTVLK